MTPRARPLLLLVVNVDWFFMSHRLPVALAALEAGYEVHVATALTTHRASMEAQGLVVHPLGLHRSDASPAGAWRLFRELRALFRQLRPDLVHLVTIKPVVFGGIAARLAGVNAVVAAVSGLGFVFVAKGWRAAARRLAVATLYRWALGGNNLKIIFQNPDDRDSLLRLTGLPAGKVEMIRGSGVDLAAYAPSPMPPGRPVVLMAARLLADKGAREFVEAARLLKGRGSDARFVLAGAPDPSNPSSIPDEEIQQWRADGAVELPGHQEAMVPVLSAASIVVLPSYREGLPKVLIEAAACGRPVVTTDVPGCRDAIEAGTTGLLVPPGDARALADTVEQLIAQPARLEAMGSAGRRLAEQEFGVETVCRRHLAIYGTLLAAHAPGGQTGGA